MAGTAAAVVAWIGASLFVVSDGRRGLALGTALVALALAVLALDYVGWMAALALALGGAVATARRYASGGPGWAIMPPGSTPRFVLCIAAGILALWFAGAVTTGAGAPLRFAILLVTGLAGARVYGSADPPVLLTAIALLALALGLGASLGDSAAAPWPYLAAGLIAAVIGWLPPKAPRAA